MSHVTDIILITGIDDASTMKLDSIYINLRQVDGLAGGNKAIQCDVYMCAMNYFDYSKLIEQFLSLDWEHPECAQLLIKDEHDDDFKLYRATR